MYLPSDKGFRGFAKGTKKGKAEYPLTCGLYVGIARTGGPHHVGVFRALAVNDV